LGITEKALLLAVLNITEISTKTKNTFTINGCGKFQEEKIHLSKSQASLLYIELHNWIKENL